tara:strand:- start:1075 stop:1248 length:174 start_codon:yes stop_codon:yes gene_type:complete
MIIIPQWIVTVIGISIMTYFAVTYPEPCPKEFSTSGYNLIKNCKFDQKHKAWIKKTP